MADSSTYYDKLIKLYDAFEAKYSYVESITRKSFDLHYVNYSSGIKYTKEGGKYECPDIYIDAHSGTPLQISNRNITVNCMGQINYGILVNSVTLVPYDMFSALGCSTEFNKDSMVCKISGNNTVLELMPALIAMRKNENDGYYVPLEKPARYIYDTLYVPVRAVAQQLGLSVGWDGDAYSVILEKCNDAASETILYVNKMPEQVSCNKFILTGSIWDKASKSYVYINGELAETAQINEEKNWAKEVNLTDGENKFDITVKNDNGYTYTETKTIKYVPVTPEDKSEAPVFLRLDCPQKTKSFSAEIRGVISNLEHGVSMTVNGHRFDLSGEPYNMFIFFLPLNEGENVYKFVLTNNHGQTTEVTKTITCTK
ncbi:MAG: copper amine oxidase N-terminal domain-containing protein [Clostridia bacterium]|nr:copper amine oxidase N-terminal domain-containing protein [Clostridia bacterium]